MATLSTTGKIARGQYVNEWMPLAGGRYVHRYSICGTTILDYCVLEPCATLPNGSHDHSTITHDDNGGGWLGDMTTRQLPAELDALPAYSNERYEAVTAWYDSLKAESAAIIRATYPDDFTDQAPMAAGYGTIATWQAVDVVLSGRYSFGLHADADTVYVYGARSPLAAIMAALTACGLFDILAQDSEGITVRVRAGTTWAAARAAHAAMTA